MGNALVVYTMAEEGLGWVQRQREDLRRREQGEPSLGKSAAPDFREIAMRELRIPDGGVWSPPAEPQTPDWWRRPSLRHRHAKAVRDSLEHFLNEHLSELNHMVRTGWWVLGKVRIRVEVCRPAPETEMRSIARAMRGWSPRGKTAGNRRRGAKRPR